MIIIYIKQAVTCRSCWMRITTESGSRGKFINKTDILTNTKLIVVLVPHSTRHEIDDMKQRSTMNCRPNICGYAAVVIFVCMAVLGLPGLSNGK